MAKAASGCIHDKSGNEDLTETAPFTAKIGSKRAYLPDSELPSKRTMLDTAKERPGAITRLLCEFSVPDAMTRRRSTMCHATPEL